MSVARPHSDPVGHSIEDLRRLVADDLAAVDRVIVGLLDSPVAMIPKIAGHIVSSGGKRIRPTLTLLTARMFGYDGTRHISLAACIEFIHTATLLHDDVVDGSTLRRGVATANALWGNKPPVLVGDFLLSRAFRLMVRDGSLEILGILTEASAVIAEGEIRQLAIASDLTISPDACMDVLQAKTATLFATASEIGAVVAGEDGRARKAMRDYGLSLGTAFQLVDDVLDYSALQNDFGKTIGDDFREGKITMPVLLAFDRGTPEEQRFWERTFAQLDQRNGDLEHAMTLLAHHNTLQATLDEARHHAVMARDALANLAGNAYRDALQDLIGFCIDRKF